MSATCPSLRHTAISQPDLTTSAYWHGGAPGLEVGDYILPPCVTRTCFTLSAYFGEEESRAGYQPTRVYLTSEHEVAELFAAMYPGGGWVYRVAPEGQLEQDPDVAAHGMSWACERARIVEVVPLSADRVVDILEAIFHGAATQDVRAEGQKGGAA
jgi:hypothetical protein